MSERDRRSPSDVEPGEVPPGKGPEVRRGVRARHARLLAASLLIGSIALGLWGRHATSGGGPGDLSISLSPVRPPRAAAGATVTRSVPFGRTRPGPEAGAARRPSEAQKGPRAVRFLKGPAPASLEKGAGDAFDGGSALPGAALTAAPGQLVAVQTDNFADFPGLGIDNDYVYVTANMYDRADLFQHVKVWAIRKAELLAGTSTLTWSEFVDPPGTLSTLQPAHSFGTTDGEYFVHEGYVNRREEPPARFLRLSRITFPGGTATWEDMGLIQVSFYPDAISPAAPQAGTGDRIDTTDARLLNGVYRDGALYTTHHVPSDDEVRTEVAWYQIDPTRATPAGDNVPLQQGRVADPARFYYYPSIAVNGAGDVALGFSGSSSTEFAGAFYTGRSASDNAGVMRPVVSLIEGARPYFKDFGFDNTSGTPVHRWGDFSATVVDPADDTTFWTLQEYAGAADNSWATWWGKFTVPALSLLQNHPGLTDPQAQGLPDDTWVVPPDTMGAAGPAYLVSILNSGVGVFHKDNGALISEVRLEGFWADLFASAGIDNTGIAFDPKILYDQYSGRFVAITLGLTFHDNPQGSPDSWILIAVSRTSDPNDGFDQWAIDADVDQVPAPSGRGGGGGCALAPRRSPVAAGTAAATLFLLFAPALLFAIRKTRGRKRR